MAESELTNRPENTQARDLTGRTMSGLRWSYLGTGVNAMFQVVFTAILARLLDPEAFGLVAMAMVILSFGQYFSQMGVGRALVQREAITDVDIRVAFTSSALLGAGFAVLFWFAAPLATLLFPDDHVVPVLRALSLSFLITGLSITALALLQRHLRYRAVALIEMAAYAIGYGPVGIVLASTGRGSWSLVAAGLSQAALTALFANASCRYAKRPSLDRGSLKRLYSFGSRVSAISILEFLALNLAPIWIGRRIGTGALGLFNRAFTLINVPAYYFTASLSRVMYSAMSRVQRDTPKLRMTYLSMTTVFAALVIPTCWGAAGASRQIVLVVLGPGWVDAIPVFAILAAAAPFTFLATLSGVMSEITAMLHPKLVLCLVRLLVLVALLWALSTFGVVGCALAYAVGEIVSYGAYFVLMRNVLHTTYRDLVVVQVGGYVAGVFMLGVLAAVGWLGTASNLPVLVTLLVQLVVGLLGLTWFTLRGFSGATWAAICSSLRWPERIKSTTRSGRVVLWLDAHSAITRSQRT